MVNTHIILCRGSGGVLYPYCSIDEKIKPRIHDKNGRPVLFERTRQWVAAGPVLLASVSAFPLCRGGSAAVGVFLLSRASCRCGTLAVADLLLLSLQT